MNLLVLIILSALFLFVGYHFYGRLLSRWLKIHDFNKTPAHTLNNGEDFIPTKTMYLLNQHLSAIAAAGPIVGPILAGMWFGWVPTIIWIIIGGIFIGGVHDMVSIVSSVRHQGRSIAEVIRETMNQKTYIIFLLFLWFSLIYIIAAFTDVTSSTFAESVHGPQIASSSMMYLLLALLMGITLRKKELPLWMSTFIFIPMVFGCILLGPIFPLNIPPLFGLDLRMTWNVLLILYCAIAALVPIWLLLQPRGYLGGFFMILTVGVSLLGLVVGSFLHPITIQFPAFVSWQNPQGFPLLPILFTTVACGACSGFHCLIASGTTSKQLSKESDAKKVGYGGMLIESFVAITALGTLLILTTDQMRGLKDPNMIYANGIATFLSFLNINKDFAFNFALLAFATFVYDTLDVATRLGRYIFEELTGWKNKWSPYVATITTLILPLIFLTKKFTDAQGNVIPGWKMFWTVFGASNQLLAALVLFGLSLWLFKKKLPFKFTLIPSIFMMAIALLSLYYIIRVWLGGIFIGHCSMDPIVLTSIALIFLTGMMILEGLKIFNKNKKS